MEVQNEVKVIKTDYKCPKCEIGYLRPTGQVLTSNPPQYPHMCNTEHCNYGETFLGIKYPQIDYVEINK